MIGRKLVLVVLVGVVGVWAAGCSKSDTLRTELERALGEIETLKQDVASLKSGRPDAQRQMELLRQAVADKDTVIATLRTDLDDCKKNIETLQEEVNKLRGTGGKKPTPTPKPRPKR